MDEGHHGHTDLNALSYNNIEMHTLTGILKPGFH